MPPDFSKTIHAKVREKTPNWTPPDSLYISIEERLGAAIQVFVAKHLDEIVHTSVLESLGLKPAQIVRKRANRVPKAGSGAAAKPLAKE